MNPQHIQMRPGTDKFLSFSARFVILDQTIVLPPPAKTFVFNLSYEFCDYFLSFDVCKDLFTTSLSIVSKVFFKFFSSPHFLP